MQTKNWRDQLAKLIRARDIKEYPLIVFALKPPTKDKSWPSALPSNDGIRELYSLCDGGSLSIQYAFLKHDELIPENEKWRDLLHGYFDEGIPVLIPTRHTVLGYDSGGAAIIWDAQEDLMFTFFAKGGSWEPLDLSFEDFMQTLFDNPEAVHANGMWKEALDQLNTLDI